MNDFEAFCDMWFDAAPSAKPIYPCISVLQELEWVLKQMYESVNVVHYALKLARPQDGYLVPRDVLISDAESIPKFLTKV